tara:strand:- start:10 stop:495 length:486 start_codon:yes stop_codon:yes gene_type:complete
MLSDPQFWVFVAFIIFIAAVFNPIKKILVKSLDTKIDDIKKSIDEAEQLKNEAQVTLSEIKKRQNEVSKEIELINSEAKEKIINIEKIAHEKLQEQIEKRNSINALKIEQMARDANAKIQNYIVKTAMATTIQILKEKLNDNEKQNLINRSISEFSSVIKN